MTQILEALGAGAPHAAEKLLPLVYEELRRLAAARMAHKAPGQTLQLTALVQKVKKYSTEMKYEKPSSVFA